MKQIPILISAMLSLAGPAAAQDREVVTDILWSDIEAYCAFQREGQGFDYDDPATWRFVFFSQIDTFSEPAVETAFVSIGYQLRQLDLVATDKTANGEVRHYRSLGHEPHDVVVTMIAGEEGYEAGAFSGTVAVEGPVGSEEVPFRGDCGT